LEIVPSWLLCDGISGHSFPFRGISYFDLKLAAEHLT
jgi:hypothetical protein